MGYADLWGPENSRRHSRQGVTLAVVVVGLLAAADLVTAHHFILAGLLTVGPCLAAVTSRPRIVVAVGGYVLAMVLLVSGPDRMWWTLQQAWYVVAIVAVTVASAFASSRRIAQERRVSLVQAQFTGAFNAATTGLALVNNGDPQNSGIPGVLIAANPALRRICGWESGPVPAGVAALLADPAEEPFDREVVLPDGRRMMGFVTSTRLAAGEGLPDLRLVQIEDVTGRRESHHELTRLALHDHLTGLVSRALLRDRMMHALQRCRRSGKQVGVLFLDLDRFKHINDVLGHRAGDAVLVRVAKRLTTAVRPEDTVARLGGDEFVVLLEAISSVADAEAVAQRIQHELAKPLFVEGEAYFVSASIGVAISGGPDSGPDALLHEADSAMYHAKGRGRARSEVFNEVLRRDTVERLSVEKALRRALDNHELLIHLQPIVDTHTGRVMGAEALVRWQRPGCGLMSPAAFIPVAEDCGLIGRIDAWVLGEAIRQCAEYRRQRHDADFYVSVNLSGAELADSRLPDVVAQQLRLHGLPADRLVLEVTESVYLEAVRSTPASLQTLRELKVRLALDDFGTGCSSLAYMKRFPFDIIKIDQSFIRGMLEDGVDARIVDGLLSLADALQLAVVAAGVESPALAMRMDSLRCASAQGFTWSEPVLLADLLALPDVLSPH